MRIDPPFPNIQRNDPMRRAELRIYRHLAQSSICGRALYQVRASRQSRELDFLVFLPDGTRIGIEVKGGTYRLVDGEWLLRTPDGWQRKPNPLIQLREAVEDLMHALETRLGRRVPIMPVLVFPDMKTGRETEALPNTGGARVMWRTGSFVERLAALAADWSETGSPSGVDIEEEVRAITGRCRLTSEPSCGVGLCVLPDSSL